MRRGIDAERHAAHDAQARVRQRVRESLGVAASLRRRIAAANDRESGRVQELRAAPRVQDGRRVVDLAQRLRIVRMIESDHMVARRARPRERLVEQRAIRAAGQMPRGGCIPEKSRDLIGRRRERVARRAEMLDELALGDRAHAGNEREREPCFDVARRGRCHGWACRGERENAR